MDWQQTAALGIVVGTAGVFLWGKLRRRHSMGSKPFCGGCPDKTPPAKSITYRTRKGQCPEIIVKLK